MVKLLPLLLLALFSLPAAAETLNMDVFCSPGNRDSYIPVSDRLKENSGGLLFRIEHCNQPSSYIFGTLHSDDPEVIAQAKEAFSVMRKSRRVMFELLSSGANQKQIIRHMVFSTQDPKGLLALLGKQDFRRLQKTVQETHPDFPPAVLDRYRPWAAAVLMQFPPRVADGAVMDDRMQSEAKKLGLDVRGLESVQQQFAAFEKLSPDEQLQMLKDTLDHIEEIRQGNDTMFNLYKKRDIVGIYTMSEEAFDELSDEKLREQLLNDILYARNDRMVMGMLPVLPKGNNFIAVGALHLPGERGILKQLEDKGYFINIIE